jgi:hypothetical protein
LKVGACGRAEVRKLQAVRAVGLPPGLFADAAPKVVSGWRTRAAVESPSHLRRRLGKSPQTTVTLLAALLWKREREVTDSLVDLLIATVHRVANTAPQPVVRALDLIARYAWAGNLTDNPAATGAAESWCTGTSNGAGWWFTPRRCARRRPRSTRWSRARSATAPP